MIRPPPRSPLFPSPTLSRPDRLGKLKPSFAPDGTLTAGNSTPLTDGASAVLLATPEWAARRKLPVLGFLRHGKGSLRRAASSEEHTSELQSQSNLGCRLLLD